MEHEYYNVPWRRNSACENCKNNVLNGGSGVCCCTLGLVHIGDMPTNSYDRQNIIVTTTTSTNPYFVRY